MAALSRSKPCHTGYFRSPFRMSTCRSSGYNGGEAPLAEVSPAQRKEMAMRRASATGCLLVLGGLLANPLGEVADIFAAERTSEPAVVEEPDPTLAPPEAVPATPLPVPSRASARATLGVQLLPLATAGDPYRSPVAEGALIGSILPGSPADRAGLPLGGVIVAIDGRKVGSPADAARIIHSATPEQQVEVKYYDGNRLFRKRIQLAPATVAEPLLPPQDLLEAPMPPVPPQTAAATGRTRGNRSPA